MFLRGSYTGNLTIYREIYVLNVQLIVVSVGVRGLVHLLELSGDQNTLESYAKAEEGNHLEFYVYDFFTGALMVFH